MDTPIILFFFIQIVCVNVNHLPGLNVAHHTGADIDDGGGAGGALARHQVAGGVVTSAVSDAACRRARHAVTASRCGAAVAGSVASPTLIVTSDFLYNLHGLPADARLLNRRGLPTDAVVV